MRIRICHFFILGIALLLGGCHFGARKPPTGQVVATVGDREITLRELRAELSSVPPEKTPVAQKNQRQAVLQIMIQRAVLADAARKQGLDKDPNFVLLSQRANDELLVRQLQEKIARAVPAPSTEEASQFIISNPNTFAERKIFDVEQIRLPLPTDPTFLKKLQPLTTLEEVASFLTQNYLAFQRGMGSIDSVGQNPKLVSAIVALPPEEVFVISSGNQVLINRIRAARTEPFTGDPARKYATNFLRAQHTQDAVRRQLGAFIVKAGSDISISKDYQAPPKPALATKQAKG